MRKSMGDISQYAASVALVVALVVLGAPMRARCASPYTVLHSFCQEDAPCARGSRPFGRLVQSGPDLFGLTGFLDGFGRLYKFDPATSSLTTLHAFTGGTDGEYPNFLALRPGGRLYGTASYGGKYGYGTLFEFRAGHLYVVHAFCSQAMSNCTDGANPASFTFDTAGNLYGVTYGGGANGDGEVYEISATGKFSILYSFCPRGDCRAGAGPAGIVVGKDGYLYVTTSSGGEDHGNGVGGTILKLTKSGTPTVLHNFCQQSNCVDGDEPVGPLVQASNLDFYGVTVVGGVLHDGVIQAGTVFQISPTGFFKTIHSFCGETYCADGSVPNDGLVLSKDGVSLYGVAGGIRGICVVGATPGGRWGPRLASGFAIPGGGGSYGHGVIFKITTAGAYNVVYDFCTKPGCFDGDGLGGTPIFRDDGDLYGETSGGQYLQSGVIYKLTP